MESGGIGISFHGRPVWLHLELETVFPQVSSVRIISPRHILTLKVENRFSPNPDSPLPHAAAPRLLPSLHPPPPDSSAAPLPPAPWPPPSSIAPSSSSCCGILPTAWRLGFPSVEPFSSCCRSQGQAWRRRQRRASPGPGAVKKVTPRSSRAGRGKEGDVEDL